jgi:nucleotide-binding universal stress UspA family protein
LQRSVVCGVDGSDGARAALRVARRLAGELGHRLVVAHVVQPQPTATGFGPTASQLERLPLDTLLASGEALVDRILDEEQLSGVERRVVFGFAADRLADLADDEGAELIVVGSRGRRGFKAAWLGSVSADLIGVARCPVLVVPPGVASAIGEGPTTSAEFSSVGSGEAR